MSGDGDDLVEIDLAVRRKLSEPLSSLWPGDVGIPVEVADAFQDGHFGRREQDSVFGSAARRADTEHSDLDLLVEPTAETTLFDLAAIALKLEQELGCDVDVVTADDLPADFRARVLAEAVPV